MGKKAATTRDAKCPICNLMFTKAGLPRHQTSCEKKNAVANVSIDLNDDLSWRIANEVITSNDKGDLDNKIKVFEGFSDKAKLKICYIAGITFNVYNNETEDDGKLISDIASRLSESEAQIYKSGLYGTIIKLKMVKKIINQVKSSPFELMMLDSILSEEDKNREDFSEIKEILNGPYVSNLIKIYATAINEEGLRANEDASKLISDIKEDTVDRSEIKEPSELEKTIIRMIHKIIPAYVIEKMSELKNKVENKSVIKGVDIEPLKGYSIHQGLMQEKGLEVKIDNDNIVISPSNGEWAVVFIDDLFDRVKVDYNPDKAKESKKNFNEALENTINSDAHTTLTKQSVVDNDDKAKQILLMYSQLIKNCTNEEFINKEGPKLIDFVKDNTINNLEITMNDLRNKLKQYKIYFTEAPSTTTAQAQEPIKEEGVLDQARVYATIAKGLIDDSRAGLSSGIEEAILGAIFNPNDIKEVKGNVHKITSNVLSIISNYAGKNSKRTKGSSIVDEFTKVFEDVFKEE